MESNDLVKYLFCLDNSFTDKTQRVSTIKGLILSAREFSGRNLKTGEYERNELTEYNVENHLYISKKCNGLMLYLMLLEQIGSIFKSKHTPCNSKGIERALTITSNNINSSDYVSVIGLRNSLVHRFSLCTENKGIGKSFKYQLNWGANKQIVIPAEIGWSGKFDESSNDENQTNIFVESFIDEVELILVNCFSELELGNFEIEPLTDELFARYTIF